MTKVLSLDTGYRRDYGSGVAYRKYFASPDLMFPASVKDGRLARKDRVFGVRLAGGTRAWPLAALKGQVVNDRAGLVDLVVVGDADGEGARAYESGGRRFAWGEEGALVAAGESWRMTEAALTGPGGKSLPRLPGHVAYWFAWSGFLENAALGTP